MFVPPEHTGAIGMAFRQEVQVQTRGPDGGNPTPKRQGRWPLPAFNPRGAVWWKS